MEAIIYRQGEDVEFYVEPDANEDLELNDWSLIFYSRHNDDTVVEKSDMILVSPQKYYGKIASEKTEIMNTGKYVCELLYKATSKRIAINQLAFTLVESHAKKYL